MMDNFTTIFAAIGGSTILSSTLTFLFAKRKYNSETDSIEIRNLKAAQEVYIKIIDDLKKHVNYLEEQQKEMRTEFNTRISDIKAGMSSNSKI